MEKRGQYSYENLKTCFHVVTRSFSHVVTGFRKFHVLQTYDFHVLTTLGQFLFFHVQQATLFVYSFLLSCYSIPSFLQLPGSKSWADLAAEAWADTLMLNYARKT